MTLERATAALIVFAFLFMLAHVAAAVADGAFPGGAG